MDFYEYTALSTAIIELIGWIVLLTSKKTETSILGAMIIFATWKFREVVNSQ